MNLDLDIDLFSIDENYLVQVGESSKNQREENDQTNKSNQAASLYAQYTQSDSIVDVGFRSNIGNSSSILCKFCYNPLAVYLINYDRAIKLCTNQNVSFY